MALKTLPCSGDDAPPQHRSILRVIHPVTPHKKHIHLLRISSPIDPTCRIRTKGLLWGSRGTFPATATMVVMVVVPVGLLRCSSRQPLYCRNSMYFLQKCKSKTTYGTGFFNILPILELTLTASMSTGQYRSNKSEVES